MICALGAKKGLLFLLTSLFSRSVHLFRDLHSLAASIAVREGVPFVDNVTGKRRFDFIMLKSNNRFIIPGLASDIVRVPKLAVGLQLKPAMTFIGESFSLVGVNPMPIINLPAADKSILKAEG